MFSALLVFATVAAIFMGGVIEIVTLSIVSIVYLIGTLAALFFIVFTCKPKFLDKKNIKHYVTQIRYFSNPKLLTGSSFFFVNTLFFTAGFMNMAVLSIIMGVYMCTMIALNVIANKIVHLDEFIKLEVGYKLNS